MLKEALQLVGENPEVTIAAMFAFGLGLAFSKKTAREIGTRAGWKSEISGKSFWDGWMLHMAHIDHTKNETYDEANRGLCVTVPEHLCMHEDARGEAGTIGLQECQNNFAIRQLRATPIYNKHKKK